MIPAPFERLQIKLVRGMHTPRTMGDGIAYWEETMADKHTNVLCGIIFILVALLFTWQSLSVELGAWLHIGPGGLPLILSALLAVIGIVTLIQGLRTPDVEGMGTIPWRGMVFILLAPVLFGLTVRGLGFMGAVFLTGLVAAFASTKMKPLWAFALAVVLTIFSTLVFSYGLSLPFERIGPWLRF